MRYTVSFIFLRVLATVSLKDIVVSALSVTSTDEVTGVNDGNAEFKISYELGSGENFTKVVLNKLGSNVVFEAPYFVPPSTVALDGVFLGDYASRGSTDYSSGKNNFIITLSQVTPNDEGQYSVEVSATGGNIKSSGSRLVVDFLPSTPSISGTPTQSVLGGVGPTVLTCTASLGKPQASMVWSRRIGSGAYTNITENVTMTTANNNDGTTNGTSRLRVNLDTADDGVQFRCQVSNRQATLYAETEAFKVTAPVPVSDANIQVCKTSTSQCTSPFDYYINDQVSLTCGVTSSPPIPTPHEYKWYQHVKESSVISGSVISITITESEIVLVCNASNTVRDVTHTVSKQVTIRATAPVPVSDANIQVCKTSTTQCTSPFDYYINDQVSLTCGVTSSPPIPAPHEYKWYQHVKESSVISGPVLSFTIIESQIVYVCNASNTVRGVTHTVSKQVTMRATAKPTSRTPSVDTTTFEEISTKTILGQTTVPSPHKGLTDAAVAGIVISVCLVVIVLIVFLVILIRRGIILLPRTGGNSQPNDKLHVQTPGNVHTADTVTYVNGMVRTGFPSTGHRNLDNAVADLLESLGLQSHAQAFEREQITAQSLAELTIEDLTLRLGVPLGPSRMMLKRIRTLGLHKQVDTNQVLDGAYSDVGPPVYQEAVDVAYANVAQTPVYEGLADSTKGAQGDYAKLQGATMGDKPSEYETVMKTSQ